MCALAMMRVLKIVLATARAIWVEFVIVIQATSVMCAKYMMEQNVRMHALNVACALKEDVNAIVLGLVSHVRLRHVQINALSTVIATHETGNVCVIGDSSVKTVPVMWVITHQCQKITRG
mmetsp:Transcript_5084/g.7504  ORF Transcript_5084/g.7504 Transcript_5084/m.7504 type:complete len:120 (-) Transcript_5084:54-413(-)